MRNKSKWLLSFMLTLAVMFSIAVPAFATGVTEPTSSPDVVGVIVNEGEEEGAVLPPEGIPISDETEGVAASNSLKEGYRRIYVELALTEAQFLIAPDFEVRLLNESDTIGKLTVNTTAVGYKYVSPAWGSYTLSLEKDGVARQF